METSERVAEIAARLMNHEDPDVRAVAASALAQANRTACILEAIKGVDAGAERFSVPGQWAVYRNEAGGIVVEVQP
jgi:hypothetical protein